MMCVPDLPRVLWLCVLLTALPGVAGAEEEPSADEGRSQLLSLPIPVNEEVTGIKIPYYTRTGVLQMNFDATTARRIDENHLQLSFLNIELFDDKGKPDMMIRLPRSVLDMRTEIISSEDEFQIKRSDFQLTGERMTFDTRTRQGTIQGKVRMVILERGMMDAKPGTDEQKKN